MNQIEIGSVVQLKSGGPFMTVAAIEQGEGAQSGITGINCVWFDSGYHTQAFRSENLTVIKTNSQILAEGA